MDKILDAFLGAIGAGILTLIILLIKILWKKFKADTITLHSLSHDAFFRMCRYLLDQDGITEAELENVNYLYKGYKAQGLNGTGDELYKRVMKLKLK